MAATLVIGSQWGDEGKGKIIDYLSKKADCVVRFHGGNNAGHTVINEFGKFALHLIPAGIFSKKTTAYITNGTVIDLEVLLLEIDVLKKAGIDVASKLSISPKCHIIMPYHKLLDRLYEDAKGKQKTGTTGRGIGPVYADKASYNGIRLGDVLDKKLFLQKLTVQLSVKNKIITALGGKPFSVASIEKEYSKLRRQIKLYVKEPYAKIQKALKDNKEILLEGAQGVFLDTDWGTYPFATASTTLSGGITAGAGIAPHYLTRVVGVTKAYTTRVGGGPFPTELFDKFGDQLRTIGNEFGATTGRPRRCGWFDAELVKFAVEINGFTEIALTKMDILDTFDTIKICIGYLKNNKPIRYYECDAPLLEKVKPVYKILKGWKSPTNGITEYGKLPSAAKAYIKELEKQINCKITYVSTGQKTEEIITI